MAYDNFLNELGLIKEQVWKQLERSLIERAPLEHYQAVNEYPRRQGKYFRPGLVMMATELFGGQRDEAVLTAVAMQLSEEWLLVHDDFFDKSEERRSSKDECRPALHKIYGDEVAVNAGDALHAIMWRVLGDNVRLLGPERGWQIFEKMNDIILRTLEGQFMDIDWIRKNRIDISEDEYFEMIDIKAGYYTVSGPLELGAMVAGWPNDKMATIAKWSMQFGRAFQIWDDVMNLNESSTTQGKENAGDILEGKRTLILIHLLENCSPAEKSLVRRIYEKTRVEKTEEEKQYVLQLMRRYGSIDYAGTQAKSYARQARKIFDGQVSQIPNERIKQIIREGIEFVANRER